VNEDILRRIKSGEITGVIVCRKPSPFNRPPGAKRGYFCAVCQKEVEATLKGQAQIAAGGIAVCNPCGLRMAEETENNRTLEGVHISPEAAASIATGRSPLGPAFSRIFRKNPYGSDKP
jgi:transcription elongation factor Elf1